MTEENKSIDSSLPMDNAKKACLLILISVNTNNKNSDLNIISSRYNCILLNIYFYFTTLSSSVAANFPKLLAAEGLAPVINFLSI